MRYLIIIPAYNVSIKILEVLNGLQDLKENTIVINDASTDNTKNIVEENGFKCVSHLFNKGMGGAIKTGIQYGLDNGYTHAISLDGDGQHDSRLIIKFLSQIINYDFVIGNRFHSINNIPSPKVASNTFGSYLVNMVFNTSLKDVACGFRAFKLQKSYLEINDNGYGFVFKQLFEYLSISASISTVEMSAIYFENELNATRHSEIESFLKTIAPYTRALNVRSKIESLIQSVEKKENIQITLANKRFYGFYLKDYDMYLLQMSCS